MDYCTRFDRNWDHGMGTINSGIWGNQEFNITQEFGIPGHKPEWYDYSKYHGFPPGYHIGLDVGMPLMTPLMSGEMARVSKVGTPAGGFRPEPVYTVSIDDPGTPQDEGGYTTIYGHIWQAEVEEGDTVEMGTLLGYSGEQTIRGTWTPDGSGPHLHLERLDPNNDAIDPKPFAARSSEEYQKDLEECKQQVADGEFDNPIKIPGIPEIDLPDLPGLLDDEKLVLSCMRQKGWEREAFPGVDDVRDTVGSLAGLSSAIQDDLIPAIRTFFRSAGIIGLAGVLIFVGFRSFMR